MTVFALGYGTKTLGYDKEQFLLLQMAGIVFFALGIPLSAKFGDRHGASLAMMLASIASVVFGLVLAPLFQARHPLQVLAFLSLGFFLIGLMYGPCGALLAELYPTEVRYTGASLSFNLAGILGAAPAPYVATQLAASYGVQSVGDYLSASAVLSLIALMLAQRWRR